MSIRDSKLEPAYLGDSVYAAPSHPDGERLKLYLDNGAGKHAIIVIEPEVWTALKKYVERSFPQWKDA